MSKKRVHEIAKEQGLSSKELLEKLRAAGIEAKAAASSVEETLALKALSDGGAPAASNGADPAAGAGKDGKAPAKAARAKTDATEADAPAAEKTAPSATPAPSSAATAPAGAAAAAPTGAKPSAPASAAAPSGSGPAGSAGSSASAPPPTAAPPAPQAPPGGERVRPTRDSRTGERTPGDVGPGGRRRVVIDSQASRRQQGGPANQPQRRPRRGRRRRGTYDETIAPIDTYAMEATAEIRVNSGSTVKDVAEYLGVPVPEIIKKLMTLGEMATLTQTLSDEAIQVLADEFEKKIEIVHAADDVEVEPAFEDAAEDLVERPPVVTIMG